MLLSIISAILLIFAFPNYHLSYLAFIGFVPLLLAIRDKTPRKAFFISYVCGFLFCLGTLYWLYYVTIFGLIVLCVYLALYFGIFGLFFNWISSEKRRDKITCAPYFSLLAIPVAWTALEYIQSRLFGGFGWTLLGYSQYRNLPFIQIADFSGVYGVSFVIMMVNVGIYRALKKSFGGLVVSCLVIALVVGYGYGAMKENGKGQEKDIKVSIIQGNIPQEIKWDPEASIDILDKYTDLTRLAVFDSPDLIIWPETSFPGFFGIDKLFTDRVLKLAKDVKTPLLLGANTGEGFKNFNSAILISEKGEVIDRYDKIHLVPFGEYVPFSTRLPFLRRLVLGEFGEFTAGDDFKVFPLFEGFGVLICFEDIFPSLARQFVKNGAQFLVVITNDAWYGRSSAPYQHAACSVFRAIENRVPVVRCANTGYSCFIDSRGRIYDSVEKNGEHLFITGHKTSQLK